MNSVARVTAVVSDVRHASSEQSTGVSEVGQTVSELDEATQQNAALAGQSATAAESLKRQGQQLVQAMAFFITRLLWATIPVIVGLSVASSVGALFVLTELMGMGDGPAFAAH